MEYLIVPHWRAVWLYLFHLERHLQPHDGETRRRRHGCGCGISRRWMFVVCAIIVASLVSVTGIIGFVGLMVPHIVRLLSGTSNNKVIIPLSAIFGATYLIWADAAARGLLAQQNLLQVLSQPLLGAPFSSILWLQEQRRGTVVSA